MSLVKRHTEGGAEMQNGLASHLYMAVKNWEGDLSFRGPHEQQGATTPH